MTGQGSVDDRPGRTPLFAGALVILAAVVAAYLPAIHGDFIWDDNQYVTANPTLTSVGGLGRIWFELGATPQYYPLVFTTFWIEYHLWGLEPIGYHFVNVLLHGVGAVLLWRILRRLHVPGAWLAAVVFALHPVQVESVAWITERKNVLSGVFYFLSLLAYLRFDRLDGSERPIDHKSLSYVVAFCLFVAALLCKTVTCSLPAVVILLIWWKRGGLTLRTVAPLVPFLGIGMLAGLLTAWLERSHVGAEGVEWSFTGPERLLIASKALWFYVGKLLYPASLAFNYPRWAVNASRWSSYFWPLASASVLLAFWLGRSRIGKGPLVAALFFGGTLVPALGFFNLYPMRYSFVADHFQYIASIGPITMLSAVLALGWAWWTGRNAPTARRSTPSVAFRFGQSLLMIAWPGFLAVLTFGQARAYKNQDTLWHDTLRKNPASWLAHSSLGNLAQQRGDYDSAAAHHRKVLALKPGDANAHHNLGNALLELGKRDGDNESILRAIDQYRRSLRIRPSDPQTLFNLGNAMLELGNLEQAIEQYRLALLIDPRLPFVHNNLANALVMRKRPGEAIAHYRQALETLPRYIPARLNLASVLMNSGHEEEAADHFRTVLRIDPKNTAARAALDSMSSPPGGR